VRKERVWAGLLGLERAVVESVEIDEKGQVVAAVRPHHAERDRCGICGRRAPGFDLGEGRRRWRALDLDTTIAHLEADAPRVRCPEHGVVVGAVPWARHGSRFTRAFEQQVAWLAVNTSGSAVAELMRIAPGAASGRSASRWPPRPGARRTCSLACAGSASTRSPTARASAT
jgi:transposase